MNTVKLVNIDGSTSDFKLSGISSSDLQTSQFHSRKAFAAAHVVIDPLRSADALHGAVIDWEKTLAYREYLWSLGFGVAEAMDTAQRGMGLPWERALELITRSSKLAKGRGALIASGAGTDHLDGGLEHSLLDVRKAYELQCRAIEGAGSQIILMASRALAKTATSFEDYLSVYSDVLAGTSEPVILHWLGNMFDPALAGYWGSRDVLIAAQNCLKIIEANQAKVCGIKISLLDADLEIELRRLLPPHVRMYTGDDFNFDKLILGDAFGHSDALLGIFDPIAPVASAALAALDRGDTARYKELLAPTVPLSRHLFSYPTYAYKTGVVFLAYINGHQDHFRMLSGAEGARSLSHLCEILRLADAAALIRDPELAAFRMKLVLSIGGVS